MNPEDDDDQYMRLPEVLRWLGVGRSTVYAWEAAGLIPRRRQLGPRAVGWLRREMREWSKQRPRVNKKTPKNSGRTPQVPDSWPEHGSDATQ